MPKKFIDLFCGIGGFHQALENLGFECVMACDIDKNCQDTYFKNFGLKPEGDIRDIDIESIEKFDVLCAGFPCQPFSKSGKREGFNDDRGNLFFNICDIVEYHKPKYLILENVRNICSHDNGNTWNTIRENIEKLGYLTYENPIILNVLHFNIPQNRERAIILCKRKDLGKLPKLPTIVKTAKKCLTRSINEFVDSEYDSKYKLTGKMKHVERIWNEFVVLLIENGLQVPKYPVWIDWWCKNLSSLTEDEEKFYIKYKSIIDRNVAFYEDNEDILVDWLNESLEDEYFFGAVRKFEWQAGDTRPDDSMKTILWTARGSGIRVKRLDYIPTLVAMSMIPVYGPQSRKLSPKELLKLQSFKEDFIFNEKHIMKQLGNAVNVKMIEQCAKFLIFNKDLFE